MVHRKATGIYLHLNLLIMFVRVFQAVVISVAFIGWILYQLMNKKKRLAELTNDIFAIVFFVSIWLGIFYFLIS